MSHRWNIQDSAPRWRPAPILGVLMLGWVVAAHAQPSAQPYTPDQLTTPPAVSSSQEAARIIQDSYPSALLERGIGGKVLLQFIVEADGTIDKESVEVVAATIRRLGEAAKKAMPQIRFTPGTVDGQPVRSLIRYAVEYRTG